MGKLPLSLVVLRAAILFPLAGCASAVYRPSVAIAITVAGGSVPSSEDIASIHKAMLPDIERAGYRLAANYYSADYIMQVRYSPDSGSAGSHIRVVSVTPNNGIGDGSAAAREFKTISDRAISEMIREPKE